MKKASISSDKIKNLLMKNKEFKDEYDNLGPRYELISQVIENRIKNNMTQEELANRVGIKRSNISRFESGNYNPSLDFIIKVASALKMKVKVSLL